MYAKTSFSHAIDERMHGFTKTTKAQFGQSITRQISCMAKPTKLE